MTLAAALTPLADIGFFGVIALSIGFLGYCLWAALGVIERMHHRRRHDDDDEG